VRVRDHLVLAASLLETLRGQPEPTSLVALMAATGLHANTLREHLAALVLVRRHRADPSGRGRPAWLYESSGSDEGDGHSEYAGLAAALSSAIHHTSDTPREDAIMAGTEWGHALVQRSGTPTTTTSAVAARRKVVGLLTDMGFAPEPANDCPSYASPAVRCWKPRTSTPPCCGVHLGIVRGALEEYGADPTGTDLLPFSEPGACRLELLARPADETR